MTCDLEWTRDKDGGVYYSPISGRAKEFFEHSFAPASHDPRLEGSFGFPMMKGEHPATMLNSIRRNGFTVAPYDRSDPSLGGRLKQEG